MCIKINIKIIWLKIKWKTFLYDNQTKIKLFSLTEQCHDPVASDTVQTASSKKNEKQFLIKFKRESCKSYRWVYKFALTIAFIWFKLIYIRVCIYYSDIKKRKTNIIRVSPSIIILGPQSCGRLSPEAETYYDIYMHFLNGLCKFIIKLFWSKLTHA